MTTIEEYHERKWRDGVYEDWRLAIDRELVTLPDTPDRSEKARQLAREHNPVLYQQLVLASGKDADPYRGR